jgi:hypothetical protein
MNQKTQSLITEIEIKIKETKQFITNHKQEIFNQENSLQHFINQLKQIKKDMKNTNKINAANSETNIKYYGQENRLRISRSLSGGVCATSFTTGASLGVTAACGGLGFSAVKWPKPPVFSIAVAMTI